MVRCVIIGAVEISNYSRIKSYLRPDDFYICCDGGLDHAENLGIKPNLIIGDFDSHEKPQPKIETIQLPCEKDDTDSFYACKEAIRRGFNDFLLLGVIGQRFDHSLVNISLIVRSLVLYAKYSKLCTYFLTIRKHIFINNIL